MTHKWVDIGKLAYTHTAIQGPSPAKPSSPNPPTQKKKTAFS